jgi:uncharacterized protein (DUF697 family)
MSNHLIIHTHAAAAAGIGAGLAQLPGADAPLLVALQANMVRVIADSHGLAISETVALQFVMGLLATMGGRSLSQLGIGWLPGWGNAINASTAAGITEAVGWAAVRWARSRAALGPSP